MEYAYQYEQGPIRPPSESQSLLLRVTRNCTWNRCHFCTLYKGDSFSIRSVEEVKQDIDGMKATGYYEDCRSAFLQDANSIVLQPAKMAEILRYLKEKFPAIDRITTYGRADTLSRISVEDYKILKEAGLNRIHSGYESGSDRVLTLIQKGTTKEQEIEAGLRIREAGIQLSVYFMPGVGGRELSEENYRETADVMNRINPDYIRIRTFVPKAESGMQKLIDEGRFTECTDLEKALELKHFIENLHPSSSRIVSDHIINLLENVKGTLPQDKEKILAVFEELEGLTPENQRSYQIARRIGLVRGIRDMKALNDEQMQRVKELQKTAENYGFEEFLRELLRRYI